MAGPSSSIDLGLPAQPTYTGDVILYDELSSIYNAIRLLANGLDLYTGEGKAQIEAQITSSQTDSLVAAIKQELVDLRNSIEVITGTNWAQPGDIGSVTPATVAATTLTASGGSSLSDTTTGKFGANGKAAQAAVVLPANATDLATAITLVNAIKAALIANGIGA